MSDRADELTPQAIAAYRRNFQQRLQARCQAAEARRSRAKKAVSRAIAALMPGYPAVKRVYLFGSIVKPGRFNETTSDIDIGIEGATMALCFDIWRDLEQALPDWAMDVRPLPPQDPFTERIRQKGELVYERQDTGS